MAKYVYILLSILYFACAQTHKPRGHTVEESRETVQVGRQGAADTVLPTANGTGDVRKGIPENYSELKKSPSNGRRMGKTAADLDNDNRADTAFIVENESDFANYVLLVYLTSRDTTYRFKLIDNFAPDFNLFPVPLKAKNGVLEVGYFRDGTAAFGRFFKFRFDDRLTNFRLIGYDSGYRAGAGERYDKSYNLLNGNYVVKVQRTLPNTHTEIFKGSEKMESIYMNDIDIQMVEKLDQIGSEFEN